MMICVLAMHVLAFSGPLHGSTRLHRARCSAYAPSAIVMGPPTLKSVQKDVDERMAKSIQALSISLSTIRTGRANPAMLDRITVDYYGAPTPLNQMASVSTPTAQQLLIDAYDKSALKDIERALMEADLGMTPSNDGNLIRLNVPPLTEERRKEFAKQAKAFGEDAKVALRNIRRDAMDSIKKMEKSKEEPLGKDESADAQDKVDASVKKFTKQIDETVASKEKEILKI
jgi:ribosome recycling factor